MDKRRRPAAYIYKDTKQRNPNLMCPRVYSLCLCSLCFRNSINELPRVAKNAVNFEFESNFSYPASPAVIVISTVTVLRAITHDDRYSERVVNTYHVRKKRR